MIKPVKQDPASVVLSRRADRKNCAFVRKSRQEFLVILRDCRMNEHEWTNEFKELSRDRSRRGAGGLGGGRSESDLIKIRLSEVVPFRSPRESNR